MSADLVIAGGTVVLPEGPRLADVIVTGDRIVGLADPGTGRGVQVEDARGRIVLPGGVDPHVHLMVSFMGQRSIYDFESGGIAALRGGTTTIVDFALQRRGGSMLAGLGHRQKQAANATLDHGLHLIVTDVNAASLAELPALKAAGVSTLKVYMIYEEDGLKLEDGALHALMQAAAAEDMTVILHAENAGIIERLRAEAVAAGHTAPRWHARTRPPVTEIEAVSRALVFAADTGCPLHILHMVAGDGVDLVAQARRAGRRVTGETCTHYLALTDTAYERTDANFYVMSPPLRDAANQARLWDALNAGALSAITSDEVSYTAASKSQGSFAEIANGCPGVEARLPVAYTLGVAEGRMSLTRFAEVFATDPARIFGLGERKGRIAPGYDADLVVIDPDARRRIGTATDYGAIGYNPYEGMEVTGWPVLTIARGRVTVRGGAFLGQAGQGRFLHRGPADMPGLG